MAPKYVAWVLAAAAGIGCSGNSKTALAPLGSVADDAGGGGNEGSRDGGGVSGGGSGARLDSDSIYLYGYVRDWNSDWPALAAFGVDTDFWSGIPQIVRSDGTYMLGLRASDGAPVYAELESVRAAKSDVFDFAVGMTANVADNDETLGLCPYPATLGEAALVPGTDEVLYSCGGYGEMRWFLNGERQDVNIGNASLIALGRNNLGLIYREGATMLWWRDSNKTLALVDGPERIVSVRATDNGFWVLTGEDGLSDLIAKWKLSRWTVTADGKSKRDGELPILPKTHEVTSCLLTAAGDVGCLLRNAAGAYLYRLTPGGAEATLVKSFPLSVAHPFEPPYVRPGAYSVLVTGVGPKGKN